MLLTTAPSLNPICLQDTNESMPVNPWSQTAPHTPLKKSSNLPVKVPLVSASQFLGCSWMHFYPATTSPLFTSLTLILVSVGIDAPGLLPVHSIPIEFGVA